MDNNFKFIMPNAVSESLYFVVRFCIFPRPIIAKLAFYLHTLSPVLNTLFFTKPDLPACYLYQHFIKGSLLTLFLFIYDSYMSSLSCHFIFE